MLKASVVGVGHLGRFHAQKYKILDNVELVSVCDSNRERAQKIGEELNVPYYSSIEEALEDVDLISIATPATNHFEVAKKALNRGIHCLIEKPFTRTVAEAKKLCDLAEAKKLTVQIGHLERFNTVVSQGYHLIKDPRFTECHRLAPFTSRSTDIDVVLDLMVHDIDLVLGVFGNNISEIDAVGVPVLTDKIDIAHAKLVFENGAMANLTASRISQKIVRKMRIFQRYCYLGLDFQKAVVEVYERIGDSGDYHIQGNVMPLENKDSLMEEIRSFVNAVETKTSPVVTAYDGYLTMDVAHRVKNRIKERIGLI